MRLYASHESLIMPKPTNAQAAILDLLFTKYEAILPIEAQWHIRFKQGDMRPRIDYFHDAVQAFSQSAQSLQNHPRLSVEHIAHDLAQLRQIQQKPLGNIYGAIEESPASALIKLDKGLAPPTRKTPPIQVRATLKQHYQNYMVFYAALLCDAADQDYFARNEQTEETIADIGLIEEMLKQLLQNRLSQSQAMAELGNIMHDDLRVRIQSLLTQKKMGEREVNEALSATKKLEEKLANDTETLDQRHLQMLTAKLSIFHNAKDTVQQLMQSGLNLAGKFLAQATQSASKEQGRGA
jgi:hypothetical protein